MNLIEIGDIYLNNTNHLIDISSIQIIDTVMQNSVNIIQSSGETGGNYRIESKKFIIPANSELYQDYTWNYPIAVMTVNWITDTTHVGDIINGYIAPNSTIGIITNDIKMGDTLIHVSPSVLNINKGYLVNITNNINSIIMGEVISIDIINHTLLLSLPASDNINAPAFLQMTICNIIYI